MKNIRIDGDVLVYDCDAKNCEAPQEPHIISKKEIMAAIDLTYRQFSNNRDPRTESVLVALNLLWELLFEADEGKELPNSDMHWHKEFKEFIRELDHKHSVVASDEDDGSEGPEYLN